MKTALIREVSNTGHYVAVMENGAIIEIDCVVPMYITEDAEYEAVLGIGILGSADEIREMGKTLMTWADFVSDVESALPDFELETEYENSEGDVIYTVKLNRNDLLKFISHVKNQYA